MHMEGRGYRGKNGRRFAAVVMSLATIAVVATGVSVGTVRGAAQSTATTPSPSPTPSSNSHHTVQIPAECQDASAFVHVAFQGPTCQAHGQWVVRLKNGNALTVAPPDRIAALTSQGLPATTSVAGAVPAYVCVNPSNHTHVELYYAHFAGESDNYGSLVGDIQSQLWMVDANYVDYDALLYGGPDEHLYVECDSGGNPVVHDIGLSTSIGGSDFSTIVSDMQNQGHSSSLAHYWVWTDGNPTSGYAGQSSVIGDDSTGTSNAIDNSSAYSINYGYRGVSGASIFAHENGHAMGAVQLSAPDTSGAWHCTDGLDVMCYNDGGPNAWAYSSSICGDAPNGTSLFDCRRDNYFNPCPAPGNYLATHWNVASPNNLWLQVSSGTTTNWYFPPAQVIRGTQTNLTVQVLGGGCGGGGTVSFRTSSGTLGTASVGSNGLASLSLGSLALGSYTVTASYGGTATSGPSSTPVPLTFLVVNPPFKSVDVMERWGGTAPVQASQIAGTPDQWTGWAIARGMVLTPSGTGGYVLDGWGGVHAFGTASPVNVTGYWPGWDIARGLVLRSDGKSGYVLDGWGGLHPFGVSGDMPPYVTNATGYWAGWDIAKGVVLRSDGASGYVLDGFGAIHPFGGAPSLGISGYWAGWNIANGFTLDPDGAGGYVLDGFGGLHPFGNAPAVSVTAYWSGWDIARSVVSVPGTPTQGWVLDGFGGLHPYGGAASVTVTGYWGSDFASVVAAA
jgi:hypothetical protein